MFFVRISSHSPTLTLLPPRRPEQVSPEMKALNKRFGKLHGISSLVNLVYLAAAAGHAAWIAEYGA